MKNKEENISGGSAILGQALMLLFFTPYCLFLLYFIFTKSFSFDAVAFLLLILIASILAVVYAYTYSDLKLEEDNIIIKKLFYVKRKPIADYKTVESALMPLKYCIKFQDGSKTCFMLSSTSIFRHVLSSDPNRILNELRTKLELHKKIHSRLDKQITTQL